MVAVANCKRRLQRLQRMAGTAGRPMAKDLTNRAGAGVGLLCMGLGYVRRAACKGPRASRGGGFRPRPLLAAILCVGSSLPHAKQGHTRSGGLSGPSASVRAVRCAEAIHRWRCIYVAATAA